MPRLSPTYTWTAEPRPGASTYAARLERTSIDETETDTLLVCSHRHRSVEAALACPDARRAFREAEASRNPSVAEEPRR